MRRAADDREARGLAPRFAVPLLLAGCAACVMPSVGIEPRYAAVDIGGDIGIDAVTVEADNSVDDLGIVKDDGSVALRGDFEWSGSHLTVMLQRSTHDGDGVLSSDLTQGGTTIPAGTAVATDLDLGLNSAVLTFDVVPGDWELGLGFGLATIDIDLVTRDLPGTSTIAVDETLPIPFLAARGGAHLGRLELEALVGFLALATLAEEYHYFDVDLSGRLRLFGDAERASGWFTLGFRYTDLDIEYDVGSDEIAADVTISGPYVALRLQL